MKRILFLIFMIYAALPVSATGLKPEWSVDFSTIFDNREGDSRIIDTRTFFQTQLSPEIGVSLDSGCHTVMGGVVWTQPIGTPWREGSLEPTLYYVYRNGGVRGALGMFPRSLLVRRMPDYIWNDSNYYTQRNIRGGAVSYTSGRGFVEGVLDWRGMQTETRREAFNIIIRGEGGKAGSIFRAGGLVMMNHFALTKHSPDDEHIVDNFLYNPYVSFDAGKRIQGLDSLTVRIGLLGSVSRHREESKWHAPVGGWMEADLRWKRFGFHNTLYIGGKLFPYYSRFGDLLDQGEPYYSSNWYERASFSIAMIRSRNVDLRGMLDFNFAQNNFTFYQRLLLTVTFGNSGKRIRKPFELP